MLELLNEDIFKLSGDLMIIPVSTAGTLSAPFERGLKNMGVAIDIPQKLNLGDVHVITLDPTKPFRRIAFACCVRDYGSTYSCIRAIGHQLGASANEHLLVDVVSPILGSGAGGLTYSTSLNILRTAFYEVATNNPSITFCTPDSFVVEEVQGDLLSIDASSAQLVLRTELDKVGGLTFVNELMNSSDFFYERAREKYQEYLYYTQEPEFFHEILQHFQRNGDTYQFFLRKLEEGSPAHKFMIICGELIAYIDYNAYRKNSWNRYKDKRVLAKSGVNQTHWIKNLIKIKINQNNIHSIRAASIRNALLYLEKPSQRLTMLSENHRKKVFSDLLRVKEHFNEPFFVLTDFFRIYGIRPVNPENEGALYSRLLYLPGVKRMWLGEKADDRDHDIELDELTQQGDLEVALALVEDCLQHKLPTLDLGNCGLTDLLDVPELFDCDHLTELIISNQWAHYENGKWQPRKSGNSGSRNRITALPKQLAKLKNLTRLTCGGDWHSEVDPTQYWTITDISVLASLIKLEYLNLSNNTIKTIDPLRELGHLRELHLNNNHISDAAPLSKIRSLRDIYLSNNRISNVDFAAEITWINTLDLHANRITDLSPIEPLIAEIGIIYAKWQKSTISIGKNPLSLPPIKIVNLGTEAVLSNLRDVRLRGKYINSDIKVVLIGNSEVGKSTMVKYLDAETDLNKSHPATHWMEERLVRSKYQIKKLASKCNLHLFDFGGHDYYHDTHHLFYTANTVYLLLWQQATEHFKTRPLKQKDKHGYDKISETQDYPVKYWLEAVKFFTREVEADNFAFKTTKKASYSSPLLLIENKVASSDIAKSLNNELLRTNFPFIYEFLNLSIIKPKRNMDHFDRTFVEMLENMGIVGEVLPEFYGVVKSAIEHYRGKPVLSDIEFLTFCNERLEKSIDAQQSRILVSYLEQIGLIICSSRNLSNKVYVDKRWVIDHIHELLEGLVDRKGEFDLKYATAKMAGNEAHAWDIVMVMLEFKIIFHHPYQNTYIAPLYLPDMPAESVLLFLNDRIKPYRRFEYSGFIQKHIILSFFHQYGKDTKPDPRRIHHYYWKDALIIKDPISEQIVMIRFHLGNDNGNAYIDIFDLSELGETAFLNGVIDFINETNKEYPTEEMVTLDGKEFVSVSVLTENAQNGKLIFTERRQSERSAPVAKGLIQLKNYKMFIKEPIKRKKVVVSYSKKDVAQVHTLRRYLDPLVSAGLIEDPWYCTFLLAGDDWDAKIKHKFDEADIVFFMVSEYFYTTKYIVDHEIKNAIDRYDRDGSVKIIPIILDFYDWVRPAPHNLGRFSALPYQAKPINDFKNPKIAWSTITASVRLMIEQDLDPGKVEVIGRDLQEIYERQVAGKLDNNV